MTKAALYLRRSREDETSPEETLNIHRETLQEFAKKNNIVIVKKYEEVASGASLFGRPEMQQMLTACGTGLFEAILCMDLDRLTRGVMSEQGLILERLKDTETRVITLDKTYNLNDEADESYSEFKLFFSRQEYKTIAKRLNRGKTKGIKDGYHMFEPPFGYERVYDDKKRPSLSINKDEAEVVKQIFDMYVNRNYGTTIIANTLNSGKIMPKKSFSWSRSSVRFIIMNPVYCGKILYNRTKWIRNANSVKRLYVPKEQWIYVEGVHPAIITQELFEKAQNIRKSRSHPPAFTGELKSPYAGLLTCSVCGKKLIRQHQNKKKGRAADTRYMCLTQGCQCSCNKNTIDGIIFEKLNGINKSDIFINIESDKEDKKESILHSVNKKLSELQKQKEKLHDFLERGIYSEEVFLERYESLEKKIFTLQKVILTEQNRISAISELKYKTILQKIIKNFDKLAPRELNILLKAIISSITYSRPNTENPPEIELILK